MVTRLKVRVIPNARKNAVVSCTRDEVRLKIKAPAVEGKANAGLIEYFSELIQISRSSIQLKTGQKSRIKIIEIDEPTPDEVLDRIKAQVGSG
jgi:uncharacterized protein